MNELVIKQGFFSFTRPDGVFIQGHKQVSTAIIGGKTDDILWHIEAFPANCGSTIRGVKVGAFKRSIKGIAAARKFKMPKNGG